MASSPLWSAWLDQVHGWIRAEAGPGRLLPWVPIGYGAGIAFVVVFATTPSVAITDGLDGLLGGTAAVAFTVPVSRLK